MYGGILDGSMVKGLPAMQETQEKWVRFLGLEDSPGEGNGNPLQYSCLKNPMDRRAWQAAVHGITKSQHDSVTKYTQDMTKYTQVYTVMHQDH